MDVFDVVFNFLCGLFLVLVMIWLGILWVNFLLVLLGLGMYDWRMKLYFWLGIFVLIVNRLLGLFFIYGFFRGLLFGICFL